MDRYKRNLVLDVYDYCGNKLCSLYDSSADLGGQACNVIVTTERNGWRELSFTLPSVYTEQGEEKENYRLAYLKADYRIRLIDDYGTDWFIISEPKVTHQAFSKNISVTAGHVSQILKTKNLGLEFSDDEGNNVGTALQLLTTILNGTGWTPGDVSTFYEKDGTTEKHRSLKAEAKTGAFKLITEMCDLFDAKPVFHGNEKTVDILPMNPFSVPKNGGMPDVSSADGVVELHYGKNVSNLTRTMNTDNLVTKLYVYGSYGDKTNGYCGIDECEHTEFRMTLTSALTSGKTYWFEVMDDSGENVRRHFTAKKKVTSGATLVWSMLDPASMSYVWNEKDEYAYFVDEGTQGTELPATIEKVSVQNWYSFLMDFSYYRTVGLFDENMLQKLAAYQRKGASQYQVTYDEATAFADSLTDLALLIGSVDFCRLAVKSVGSNGAYIMLSLDRENYDKGVMYRSDYSEKEDNYFDWTAAEAISTKGLPTNSVASVIYIMHDTDPITWDKVYIKAFDDEDDPAGITLWNGTGSISINPETDRFYLFGTDNMNGKMGALETSDDAAVKSLESATKVVTTPHPVYYTTFVSNVAADPDQLNGWGWLWKYYNNDKASELYFCYTETDTTWHPVIWSNTQPSAAAGTYWYDWSKSTLYKYTNNEWSSFVNDKTKKAVSTFGTVYQKCTTRDRLRKGVYHDYVYTVPENTTLSAGRYFIRGDYDEIWVFVTKDVLSGGDTLSYNTDKAWVDQTKGGVLSTVEAKGRRFDNVSYDSEHPDWIILDEDSYKELTPITREGDIKGTNAYMQQFPDLADKAYLEDYVSSKNAQSEVTELENAMAEALGDMYREGWWQDENYVDGDEEKLYEDALDNLKKIAQPETTYSINFLDLYGSNTGMQYGASELADATEWPDLSIMSAAHLVDPEIDVNVWAYFDKIRKCYDQPAKTTAEINTNLTTMTQHSFTDVLTNIANVASEMKGKASLFDRATAITDGGKMAAERLEGAIDTAKLKIFGGASTWYTDEMGNMVFVSADGTAAMTLTGNGFSIANSKDEWGEWNWRTFGTGDGFTADEITTGYLSADRIQAHSIGSGLLSTEVNNQLTSFSEALIEIEPDKITQTVVSSKQFEEAVDSKVAYRVDIRSTSDILSSAIQQAELYAIVWKGTEDVTDRIDASRFIWKRVSQDTTADTIWNKNHSGIKRFTITAQDVWYSATYTCDINAAE